MSSTTAKPRKLKVAADRGLAAKESAAGQFEPKKKKAAAAKQVRVGSSRVAEARGVYAIERGSRAKSAAVARARETALLDNATAKPRPRKGEFNVFDVMGDVLNQALRSESDVVRAVAAGLPAVAFKHLSKELKIDHSLIAPESTIRRRVLENQRFSTDESERMVRIARVYALAVDLFGDEAAASAWLNAPGAYVPQSAAIAPYKLSVTDSGARLVEEILLRTAYGVF